MQIQPQYFSLGTLFSDRLFRIPEYQRAYAWQSKQRQDLFDDITKVHTAGSDAEHFMATIVGLRRKKISIAAQQFVKIDVVDGQQRLTTLAMLLKAMSKALNRSDKTEAKRAAEIESLLVKGNDLSLFLLQTNHDSCHVFVDYLRDGTVPAADQMTTVADQNLADAVLECEAFVQNWQKGPSTKLIDLLAIVRNRLTVIFHEIEDEALVYTVFEVLNSRGLDVTWFDKLKSLLMAMVFEHGDKGSKKQTIEELHELWKQIYATIGLRQILNKETLRFAGTLRSEECPNKPLSEEDAVGVLTSRCSKTSRKVVECTKWLLKVTRAEDQLLANHRVSAVTQIVQARLVAIAITLRNFGELDGAAVFSAWERVTFRIFGFGGEDARKKVGEYVRLARRITNENLSPKVIQEELRNIGADYPVNEAVKKLYNTGCYWGWTEQLRYFFFRYDEFLARTAGKEFNTSQWNKIWAVEPSRSVEHIRPQSKGSEEPATSGIFVHRLGNLMVIPPGLNSKLQANEPSMKANEYGSCGLLHAIEVSKMLKKAKWDRAAVEKREKRLIKWAMSEWAG